MNDGDVLGFPNEPAGPSTAAAPGVADATPPQGAPAAGRGARRRRRRRRPLLAALTGFGLVTGYLLVCLAQVWWVGRSDQARAVDAIVVLGAAQYDGRPSPQLAARLDHAADLYQQGLAPLVVVTGGKQPADRYTEAAASALYLVARGVPPAVIVQEDRGRSTWESLEGVAGLLRERGVGRVLIVTDPYHSLRSRLIAGEVGMTAYTSPTRTSPVRGFTSLRREVKEAVGVAIGRIVGFGRLWRVTG